MKPSTLAGAWVRGYRVMALFVLVVLISAVLVYPLRYLPDQYRVLGMFVFLVLVCPFLCHLGLALLFPEAPGPPAPVPAGATACPACRWEMPQDADTCPKCGWTFAVYGGPNFSLRKLPAQFPACHVRPLQPADYPACEEVYRLHEGTHFPAGYFEEFAESLRRDDICFLVAEVAGELRGFGGITLGRRADGVSAQIVYGMIHPKFQRQGYGAVLLLARLTALPKPHGHIGISLMTGGTSGSYYSRYGFTGAGLFQDEQGRTLDCHWVWLSAANWQSCRNALDKAPITFAPELPAVTFCKKDSDKQWKQVTS